MAGTPYQAGLAAALAPNPAGAMLGAAAGPKPGGLAGATLPGPQGIPAPTGVGAMDVGAGVAVEPRQAISEAVAALGKVRQAFPAASQDIDAQIARLRALANPPSAAGAAGPQAPSPAPPTAPM